MLPAVTHRMNLSKVKMVNYTAWKSGTARKIFTKSTYSSSKGHTKGGGKGKTDRECYRCGRVGHIRTDCRAKSHINGGPPKSAPKGKGVASCEDEETETSQNVPLGTIDLASFEVLSNHGDDVDDEVDVDVSTNETTEMMPPLPLISWLQENRSVLWEVSETLQ